jgi:Domain of unknown function (DUF397)
VATMDLSHVIWRKSSRSGNGDQNCVEIGTWRKGRRNGNYGKISSAERGVAVRDSKNPEGPKLAFTLPSWGVFADQAKQGSFDLVSMG